MPGGIAIFRSGFICRRMRSRRRWCCSVMGWVVRVPAANSSANIGRRAVTSWPFFNTLAAMMRSGEAGRRKNGWMLCAQRRRQSTPKATSAEKAFGNVTIPWLLMTGTKDVTFVGDADLESRLGVYPALQGAPKYQVVLDKAEHSAFTDRALPGDRETRNPSHHRAIVALSTAV